MNPEFYELLRAIKHWARVVSLAPEYDEFLGYNHEAIITYATKLVAAYYRYGDSGKSTEATGEDRPEEALAHYILKLLIRFDLRIKLSASQRRTYLTITEGLGGVNCIKIPKVALPVLAVRYILMISTDPSGKPVFKGPVNIRWKGVDNTVGVSVHAVNSSTVIFLSKQ